MHTMWPVLAALACPLGMFAMGGAAWIGARLGLQREGTAVDDSQHPGRG